MAQYDGSIRIDTLLNTSNLRRGEEEIRGSMSRISGSAKKLASVIAGAFAVGKIAQFGKEVLEAASDFEAMEAQFSQVFGGLEDVASKSLSRIAGQAGIMEERMKSSFTKIAAFAKTTGMDIESSLKLSERAMVVVADSAAFYDRSLEETTESLQSFLKGNYENDAALGLSATEFTRNAAANKLYGKSFIELSEAQKQLTLLQMVEDANRLSGAMGQAARESDTWTSQTGNLNQAWTNLKANLGRLILPMAIQAVKSIANVINAINTMLTKLNTAASAFRSFSELITGKKSQAGKSSGITKDVGAGYNEAAEGAENLADANDKAAKSAEKAKKATKNQLSSLDKLNNLSSQNSDKKGNGSGISGSVEDVDYGKAAEGETQFEKLSGVLSTIISKVKELAGLFKEGFFDGLGDYKPTLEELKKDILSIGQTLKEIFTDPGVLSASNKFAKQLSYSLGQITGSVASVGLTIAQNLVGGMENYLTKNKERIKKYIISMFNIGTEISKIIGNFSVAFADIFSVFGGDTAQKITGNLIGIFAEVNMLIQENAAKLGRDILNMITKPIIDNKDKIKTSIEGLLQAIEPFTSGLLTALQGVRDSVSDIYDKHLKPLFDSIASGLSGILGKLLDGYNTYLLPALQGLGKKFKEIIEGPFGETVNKVKGLVGKLIDVVKVLWENVLIPFFGWIADNIYPVLAPIVKFIGNTILRVFKTIIKVIGNISDVLSGVIDFIEGVFTGDWEKAWNGIESIFSGVWNGVKNLAKNGIESLKSVIKTGWDFVTLVTSTVWNGIKRDLTSIWNSIKSLGSTVFNAIKTSISTDWNGTKNITSTVWNSIKSFLSSAWSGIKSIFSNAGTWFKNKFDNAYKGVTSSFSGVSDYFSGVWKNIKSAFSGIVNWFKNEFSDAWEAVKGVFSTGGKIFDGIKDGILNGLKTVINGIIGGINKIIEVPFNGLNSALKKLKSVSIAGLKPFDWMPTINVPQIPKLATGAVIPANKEFLAVLGDQKHGRNLEAPEGLIRKIVREETAGLDKGSGEITLNLTVECEGYKLLQLIQKLDREQFAKTQRPSFQM